MASSDKTTDGRPHWSDIPRSYQLDFPATIPAFLADAVRRFGDNDLIVTAHTRHSYKEVATASRMLAKQVRRAPVGRFGTESEVAAAVVFLLSPAAAFVTGETVHVDGGVGLSKDNIRPGAPKGALSAFDSFDFARSVPAEWSLDE